eukprot:487980_1
MSFIISTILAIIFIITYYPTVTDSECCTCTTSKQTAGCSTDLTCETNVCNADSYCCAVSWDLTCATRANNICVATSPTPSPTPLPTTKSPTTRSPTTKSPSAPPTQATC